MMLTPLSEEQLAEIRKLAGLFFPPKEIALMLGIDAVEFAKAVNRENSPAYCAFYGGRLQQEMEFRSKVISLSKLGSSPAQSLVAKMIESSQAKMNNR